MDNTPIGIGGFKFQQVIQKEIDIRRSVDLSNRGQQRQPQFSQFKNDIETRTRMLMRGKTKKYTLTVSSDSSSFSISSDGSSGNTPTPTKQQLQTQQASATLKLMSSIKQQHKSQIAQSRQLPSPNEQKKINFLKGLQQNKELSESNKIDEYYQDGKIVVKLQSKDFLTFMRWQHEVEELKRKKKDFDDQKERHFNLTKGDTIQKLEEKQKEEIIEQKKKRFSESWIVGISLAKRFLRIGRARARAQLAKVKHKTEIHVPIMNDSVKSDENKSIASLRENPINQSQEQVDDD